LSSNLVMSSAASWSPRTYFDAFRGVLTAASPRRGQWSRLRPPDRTQNASSGGAIDVFDAFRCRAWGDKPLRADLIGGTTRREARFGGKTGCESHRGDNSSQRAHRDGTPGSGWNLEAPLRLKGETAVASPPPVRGKTVDPFRREIGQSTASGVARLSGIGDRELRGAEVARSRMRRSIRVDRERRREPRSRPSHRHR
jgi:hypothetical protein